MCWSPALQRSRSNLLSKEVGQVISSNTTISETRLLMLMQVRQRVLREKSLASIRSLPPQVSMAWTGPSTTVQNHTSEVSATEKPAARIRNPDDQSRMETKTSEPQSPRSQQLHEPKTQAGMCSMHVRGHSPRAASVSTAIAQILAGAAQPGHTLLPALLGTP